MLRKLLLPMLAIVVYSLVFRCAAPIREIKIPPYYEKKPHIYQDVYKKATRCIFDHISEDYQGPIPVNTRIDSLYINEDSYVLNIYLSRHFSFQPLRPFRVQEIYDLFSFYLGKEFRDYKLTIYSLKTPIHELIPNYYRSQDIEIDTTRMPREKYRSMHPISLNLHKRDWLPQKGLFNRNIAVWHSHGYYYDFEKDRWEWQRARLFNTVEDMSTMSYVIPYLVPMLENAGANVFLPRERDIQTYEIIIDNDTSLTDQQSGSYQETGAATFTTGTDAGFAIGAPPYPANENPFLNGTYREFRSDTVKSAQIQWIPQIPETGEYAVYISYHESPDNVNDARYLVFHSGGTTEFSVNQTIGGGTWIYLGTFKFHKTAPPDSAKIVLQNKSNYYGKLVTADAVRFGGGMGNIIRGGRVSGYPRFAEGARYYLQYLGMPDTLIYNLNGDSSDYRDDYQSRGEYVNYLVGNPFGPNKDRKAKGLGIPIDLSLAFHTDAGIDTSDSTIGTLMIYSLTGADTQQVFPDGMSRMANRDLADIMQTQITSDIRLKYRPDWRRRALLNADYSEAYRPNVPSCLLELLSHQNFKDMQYGLSPQFRFDASRSIYKAMLKFIATQYQYEYVVQPLPVSHFHLHFSDSAEVTLKWQPVDDPLEFSANPEKYIVYTRTETNGFDNGILVEKPYFVFKGMETGVIYSFKVAAVNKGGESFPSEILSACWNGKPESSVLVINGFDRVGPPEVVDNKYFKGFMNFLDPGVPYKYDLNYTGSQFNFDPASKFRSNDAPGHGASFANYETKIIAGNTFDFTYIHGDAIRNSGFSYVSSSDEAVMDNLILPDEYVILDIILGEEKYTPVPQAVYSYNAHRGAEADFTAFPEQFQQAITRYCDNGGRIFVSGAYIGSDLVNRIHSTKADSVFAKKVLKINWQTDHAVVTGQVFCVDSLFLPFQSQFAFNTQLQQDIYAVESPDAIDPVSGARTILRYSENRFSAATAYSGDYSIIVFGFPFETISGQENRDQIMQAIIHTLLFNSP